MKKFISALLLALFVFTPCAMAIENSNTDAPKWEDYVAPKYRNPRVDFSKKAAITETAIGGVLTSLILGAPVGIPLVIHGTTKIKMVSYANRKQIFDKKIVNAQKIQNDEERQKEYKHILKRCHLKESTKQHYMKKQAKQEAKAAKKAEKQAAKKNK